jgi:hypothetical protein
VPARDGIETAGVDGGAHGHGSRSKRVEQQAAG